MITISLATKLAPGEHHHAWRNCMLIIYAYARTITIYSNLKFQNNFIQYIIFLIIIYCWLVCKSSGVWRCLLGWVVFGALLSCTKWFRSSWWLQMPWCQTGTMASASTMLSQHWNNFNIGKVIKNWWRSIKRISASLWFKNASFSIIFYNFLMLI